MDDRFPILRQHIPTSQPYNNNDAGDLLLFASQAGRQLSKSCGGLTEFTVLVLSNDGDETCTVERISKKRGNAGPHLEHARV
jgi:hypothetical protein